MRYFSSRRKQCSSKNHSQEYRNYILKSESISSFPSTEDCDTVIIIRRNSSISNRYYYCSYYFSDQGNCYSDSIIIAYSCRLSKSRSTVKSHHHSHRDLGDFRMVRCICLLSILVM